MTRHPSRIGPRGYSCVGLVQPKHPVNVGQVLRAASCFDVDLVAISGVRYKRASADTPKAYRHLPLLHNLDDLHAVVPFDCVPVAVDLVEGAVSLEEYKHPQRAFYVFGPEDGTLGAKTLAWCRDRVSIPTTGCLNLAMAVNVILYDRRAKQMVVR